MAGMPIRRARRAVEAARVERERQVAAGAMTPEDRDAANAADDEMLRAMAAGKQSAALALPDGGAAMLPDTPQPGLLANIVPVYPKSPTAEWLIDRPDAIAKAFDEREPNRTKKTPETIERLLFLVRCGISIKDTREGPGAARQCGLDPTTVWDWLHTDPALRVRFMEARDASAVVLEDEMRAMLPTAMKHPELVRSLEFVVGRLEWLARVRDKGRYGESNRPAGGGGITFNIGTLVNQAKDAKPATDTSGAIDAECVEVPALPEKSAPAAVAAPAVLAIPLERKEAA